MDDLWVFVTKTDNQGQKHKYLFCLDCQERRWEWRDGDRIPKCDPNCCQIKEHGHNSVKVGL